MCVKEKANNVQHSSSLSIPPSSCISISLSCSIPLSPCPFPPSLLTSPVRSICFLRLSSLSLSLSRQPAQFPPLPSFSAWQHLQLPTTPPPAEQGGAAQTHVRNYGATSPVHCNSPASPPIGGSVVCGCGCDCLCGKREARYSDSLMGAPNTAPANFSPSSHRLPPDAIDDDSRARLLAPGVLRSPIPLG